MTKKTTEELEAEYMTLLANQEEARLRAELNSKIKRIKHAWFYNILEGFKQMKLKFNKKMFP